MNPECGTWFLLPWGARLHSCPGRCGPCSASGPARTGPPSHTRTALRRPGLYKQTRKRMNPSISWCCWEGCAFGAFQWWSALGFRGCIKCSNFNFIFYIQHKTKKIRLVIIFKKSIYILVIFITQGNHRWLYLIYVLSAIFETYINVDKVTFPMQQQHTYQVIIRRQLHTSMGLYFYEL